MTDGSSLNVPVDTADGVKGGWCMQKVVGTVRGNWMPSTCLHKQTLVSRTFA